MSKEKRGPRGPRGPKGEPGLTGPCGPRGETAYPEWTAHGTDIGPGLHVRCWREEVTGEKQYSIVKATVYNDGTGPQVDVVEKDTGRALTDYQIGSSYFMRFS